MVYIVCAKKKNSKENSKQNRRTWHGDGIDTFTGAEQYSNKGEVLL